MESNQPALFFLLFLSSATVIGLVVAFITTAQRRQRHHAEKVVYVAAPVHTIAPHYAMSYDARRHHNRRFM